MNNSFKEAMSLFFGRSKFWVKKNSPELLVGAGILLAAASTVLAIFETTKLEKVTTPEKKKIEKLKEEIANHDPQVPAEIDYKKELGAVRRKLVFNVCKLYAPSFISFVLSTACLLGSHKIIKGRNLALAAAYATLESNFKGYREKVANRFGKEIEQEIFRGTEKKKLTVLNEKGKEVEKEIEVDGSGSEWGVIFDESNDNWNPNSILNLEWLEMQERYANMKLKTQGYLFLNDVYKMLGLDENSVDNRRLQGSRVVGWLYDPEDHTRDSYVSFGLKDRVTGEYTKRALNMKMYGECNVFVDFNVDGDILTGRLDENGKPMKTFVTRIREIARKK